MIHQTLDWKNQTDIELVNNTLNVNKECFDELVERYYPRITRYVNRLLLHNKDEIEDCLSETFLKAYINLSTYNTRVSFSAWLYRIAHNQAVDIIRKNVRHPKEELLDHHAVYDPVSTYIDKDSLERMLETLNIEDRNLLTLYYLEELTLEEISDIMKTKSNTIAVRIKRAKEKIRKNKTLK